MTSTVPIVAGGALAGYGAFLTARALLPQRPDLGADLTALFTTPTRPAGALRRLPGQVCTLLRRYGLGRLLLADDVTLADRTDDAHMASRLVHLLGGAAAGLGCAALGHLAAPTPPLLALVLVAGGEVGGILLADRPVRRLARSRRRDAAIAVAAYVDLVRVLLVGGLPLPTALTAAADRGRGWTFDRLRAALADAKLRAEPPDRAIATLADTYQLREFTDLARTLSSARAGASPVLAFESRAQAIRRRDTADQRAQEATADAQMDLPAAVVALAFVAFLAYPLLTMINDSVGS
jgi:Flp pilus assembly protein TadB